MILKKKCEKRRNEEEEEKVEQKSKRAEIKVHKSNIHFTPWFRVKNSYLPEFQVTLIYPNSDVDNTE